MRPGSGPEGPGRCAGGTGFGRGRSPGPRPRPALRGRPVRRSAAARPGPAAGPARDPPPRRARWSSSSPAARTDPPPIGVRAVATAATVVGRYAVASSVASAECLRTARSGMAGHARNGRGRWGSGPGWAQGRDAGRGGVDAVGRSTRARRPGPPGAGPSSTEPPLVSASRRAIARPSPEPEPVVLSGARQKRSKARTCCSGLSAGPWSVTETSTAPGGRAVTSRCTRPPSGEAVMALDIRLSRICSRAPGTASTAASGPEVASRRTPPDSATDVQASSRPATTAFTSTGTGVAWPASARARTRS